MLLQLLRNECNLPTRNSEEPYLILAAQKLKKLSRLLTSGAPKLLSNDDHEFLEPIM